MEEEPESREHEAVRAEGVREATGAGDSRLEKASGTRQVGRATAGGRGAVRGRDRTGGTEWVSWGDSGSLRALSNKWVGNADRLQGR